MKFLLYIPFFCMFSVFGQEEVKVLPKEGRCVEDSLGNILMLQNTVVEAIALQVIRIETPRYTLLVKKELDQLQATDVGEILQKMPGANMKSYGGLGGLKTFSARSLGAQHSTITVDGFVVQNNQTGQVNLAQVQTNNLESVTFGNSDPNLFAAPVSSQIAGNFIGMSTFEMSFMSDLDTLQIRSNLRMGSFGQLSGYAAAKVRVKKGFVSGFGNYRLSHGLYPYLIENGSETATLSRTNNDYQDQYVGAALGYSLKYNVRLRVNYKQSKITQGLPGAVILYNNSADERLSTGDQTLSADLRWEVSDHVYFRSYVTANNNLTHYLDPSYLNSAGKIDVHYTNRVLNVGTTLFGYGKKDDVINYSLTYNGGLEYGLSDLHVSDSLFAQPVRNQISGIVGLRWRGSLFNYSGNVSSQLVSEHNAAGEKGKDVFALNPHVSIETKEMRRMDWRHRLWYKNSMRIPTFNELYYNNIGNTKLNPERAHQFNYNVSFYPVERDQMEFLVTSSIYYNRITDKIVAIPTQNLFKWSMQNVGIVRAYGAEIGVNIKKKFTKNPDFQYNLYSNYSFQRSVDITDPEHATYGHQIAYIPLHTGNVDFAFSYKGFGVGANNYAVSKRYSLNENNSVNEVPGFFITDVSLFHTFKLKTKQTLRVQFQLKNAFNESYSYIRSFVMPGRNYLISISYAFN